MSENPTENTETAAEEAETSTENAPGSFPSPIPALVKESDRAERPGFRSPANKGTKAMKKKARKGKKRR
jgi:hypothetical protein